MSEIIPWTAQFGPQSTAISKHWVEELFYGGAVGGGKTDYLLGDFAQDIPQHGQAWQGILFRKHYGDLEFIINRSKMIYPQWFPGAQWHPGDKNWTFANGACLRLRQLDHINDYEKYQGPEYTWIGWDELPQWESDKAYMMMKARLRSPFPVPNKRIRATGNPGGRGHHWVKHYFAIDRYPLGGQVFTVNGGQGRRLFIRSRLQDNKILTDNDPMYESRLDELGNSELVRAWKEGDWNVVAGAFFDEFRVDRHVLRPFTIPVNWTRIRAMDWGSASPFCVLWLAVSDGSINFIPRGALVVYREWYGASKPNTGLKLSANEVAQGIAMRENEKIDGGHLDPSAFKRDGGPSIAETFGDNKVYFTPGDNKRLPGWDQVRERLRGDGDGNPMLFIFDTCTNLIRTLPTLQHDQHKLEDVDTNMEDHAADALRYGCMGRPWIKPQHRTPQQQLNTALANFVEYKPTFNDLVKSAKNKRLENS